MSFFSDLALLPDDSILGLERLFAADARPDKINLGIGAYRDAAGFSPVLSSVKKAETFLLEKETNKNYLPIEGSSLFLTSALKLLMGEGFCSDRVFAAQTIGGTGALSIGGEFLVENKNKVIFIPTPSWPNHQNIFGRAGFSVKSYPYFDPQTHGIDFLGVCQAIEEMFAGDVILLHACCHNPTGMGFTHKEWKELSILIKKRKVIPFFDIAYQGFGVGLDEDALAVRLFYEEGHEMLVAYSFSKNFGLYGERVGVLGIISADSKYIPQIRGQVNSKIRANYSNPPIHGAHTILTILQSRELTDEWKLELEGMRRRIQKMRQLLYEALQTYHLKQDVSWLQKEQGLFSFFNLTSSGVLELRKEKGIYMPGNGRINNAGLNEENVSFVAEALMQYI